MSDHFYHEHQYWADGKAWTRSLRRRDLRMNRLEPNLVRDLIADTKDARPSVLLEINSNISNISEDWAPYIIPAPFINFITGGLGGATPTRAQVLSNVAIAAFAIMSPSALEIFLIKYFDAPTDLFVLSLAGRWLYLPLGVYTTVLLFFSWIGIPLAATWYTLLPSDARHVWRDHKIHDFLVLRIARNYSYDELQSVRNIFQKQGRRGRRSSAFLSSFAAFSAAAFALGQVILGESPRLALGSAGIALIFSWLAFRHVRREKVAREAEDAVGAALERLNTSADNS